jgi:hypothetical protein
MIKKEKIQINCFRNKLLFKLKINRFKDKDNNF